MLPSKRRNYGEKEMNFFKWIKPRPKVFCSECKHYMFDPEAKLSRLAHECWFPGQAILYIIKDDPIKRAHKITIPEQWVVASDKNCNNHCKDFEDII